MSNYWVGVITGCCCSLLLTICTGLVCMSKVHALEQQMAELSLKQAQQAEWIADNETVMRTYKFFNQSWQAIIDMNKNEEDR